MARKELAVVEKDVEFQTHYCADSPDGAAVVVFNSELTGEQDTQICAVPIYEATRPRGDAEDPDIERRRANAIGDFVAAALNAYVATPEGNEAYARLLVPLYAFAKKYGPDPEYFDGMRVCRVGHTFHIDDAESLIADGEPGERRCPVCRVLVV